MYAINVFVTFSLSQLGHVPVLVAAHRARSSTGSGRSRLHVVALVLCVAILVVHRGAEVLAGRLGHLAGHRGPRRSLSVPSNLHYRHVAQQLPRLDLELGDLGLLPRAKAASPTPRSRPRCSWWAATAASASTRCSPSSAATPATSRTSSSCRWRCSIRAASRARKKSSGCKRRRASRSTSTSSWRAASAGARSSRMGSGLDAVKVATSLCTDAGRRVSARRLLRRQAHLEARNLVAAHPAQRNRLPDRAAPALEGTAHGRAADSRRSGIRGPRRARSSRRLARCAPNPFGGCPGFQMLVSAPNVRPSIQEDPPRLSRLLRGQGPRRGRQLVAGSRQRPDAAVRQRRDEPVQGRVHRQGHARDPRAPPARRSACAPAASTTTSRTWAAPRATTPSSRCWATSPSATTSSPTPSPSPTSC